MPADAPQTVHASCVAVAGRGVLILGPSGSGKSALALNLIARGAGLVADDRTILTRTAAGITATCPAALAGMIEARGIGLLNAPTVTSALLALVVDLGRTETDRLPPPRRHDLLGCSLDLVLGTQNPHFPAALWVYLLHGRHDG